MYILHEQGQKQWCSEVLTSPCYVHEDQMQQCGECSCISFSPIIGGMSLTIELTILNTFGTRISSSLLNLSHVNDIRLSLSFFIKIEFELCLQSSQVSSETTFAAASTTSLGFSFTNKLMTVCSTFSDLQIALHSAW